MSTKNSSPNPDSQSCPYCGATENLYALDGSRNQFCGCCGKPIIWETPDKPKTLNERSNWAIAENAQELIKCLQFASQNIPYQKTREAANKFLKKIKGNNRFAVSKNFIVITTYPENSLK